ncbi:hypothetical protein [Hymenobacter daeguensis]
MSPPLRYYIKFETNESMPRIERLLLNTRDITGMSIVVTGEVDENGNKGVFWIIKAKSKGVVFKKPMEVKVFEYDGEYIIMSNPSSKEAPYLVGSLLFVLRQLGGKLSGVLPDWAGEPWETVRHGWDSSKAHIA